MEFIKNLFKDDDKIIGLCALKKEEKRRIYIPEFNPGRSIYNTNYPRNFFLL